MIELESPQGKKQRAIPERGSEDVSGAVITELATLVHGKLPEQEIEYQPFIPPQRYFV